eukprot:1260667-Pleurochrysis_carterae.AAC.1
MDIRRKENERASGQDAAERAAGYPEDFFNEERMPGSEKDLLCAERERRGSRDGVCVRACVRAYAHARGRVRKSVRTPPACSAASLISRRAFCAWLRSAATMALGPSMSLSSTLHPPVVSISSTSSLPTSSSAPSMRGSSLRKEAREGESRTVKEAGDGGRG